MPPEVTDNETSGTLLDALVQPSPKSGEGGSRTPEGQSPADLQSYIWPVLLFPITAYFAR